MAKRRPSSGFFSFGGNSETGSRQRDENKESSGLLPPRPPSHRSPSPPPSVEFGNTRRQRSESRNTTNMLPGGGCLPLSMQLLKYTPGFYCSDCSCRNNHNNNSSHSQNNNNSFNDLLLGSMAESARNNNNNNTIHSPNSTGSSSRRQLLEDQQDLNDDHSCLAEDYDIPALRRQNSATSPLVVAPMMLPNLTTLKHHTVVVERIISEYMVACRFYGATANAGVVTTFRFSLPALRTTGNFGDKDTLALAEIMLHYINGPLRYIKRLDFSKAREGGSKAERIGIRSHGAMALSKVLQKSRFVEEVFLERNHIGPYGASALFIACSTNSSIKHIKLRRCQVGERGAFAFAEWIAPSATCGLGEIDLSANFIGFKGSLAIERAMTARTERTDLEYMHVNLEGNLVLQEVMNGITHGLGALLAFAAIYLLYHSVKDQPSRHFVSCMVYSASLVVLYISSTLYHSFFILQHTKYIFEVLDKCAIYILIAGSYTPFLQIVLWKEAMYSVYLLTFIWVCGFLGICVEAFFPTYRYKQFFSLAMYLGMGWSALICLPEVARKLPEGCTNLMILGGVGYTAGVPFFVRNNNLDHAIWHLFVLAGSICHWCGIYFYVTHYEEP